MKKIILTVISLVIFNLSFSQTVKLKKQHGKSAIVSAVFSLFNAFSDKKIEENKFYCILFTDDYYGFYHTQGSKFILDKDTNVVYYSENEILQHIYRINKDDNDNLLAKWNNQTLPKFTFGETSIDTSGFNAWIYQDIQFNDPDRLKGQLFYNGKTYLNAYNNKYDAIFFLYNSLKEDLKKQNSLFAKAKIGNSNDCDTYINLYPNGRFINEVKLLRGTKYKQEQAIIENKRKQDRLARENKIKANSNKMLWKLGNKLCNSANGGVVCGTINQWNEDKSSVQIKIVTSPGGSLQGEKLEKGNLIWVSTSREGWHLCLPDELDKSLAEDNSEIKQVTNQVKPYNGVYKDWVLGKRICLSGTKGQWIFAARVKLIGEINAWNEDHSAVFIRLIEDGDGAIYNGEQLFKGKVFWVDPGNWDLCN